MHSKMDRRRRAGREEEKGREARTASQAQMATQNLERDAHQKQERRTACRALGSYQRNVVLGRDKKGSQEMADQGRMKAAAKKAC